MTKLLSLNLNFVFAMILSLGLGLSACTKKEESDGMSKDIESLVVKADQLQDEINRGLLLKDISDRDKDGVQDLIYQIKLDLIRLDKNRNDQALIKDLYRNLRELQGRQVVKRDQPRIEDFSRAVSEVLSEAAEQSSVSINNFTWGLFSSQFSEDLMPFLAYNSEWKSDWVQKDVSYAMVSGFGKKAWLISPIFDLRNIQNPAFRIKHTVVINRNSANPKEEFDREAIMRKAFKAMVSTNYEGGDPNAKEVKWSRVDLSPMPLSADFNVVYSPEINLEKFRAEKVTIAFLFDMPLELGHHYITWQIHRFDLFGNGELPPIIEHEGSLLDLKFLGGLDPFTQYIATEGGAPWEFTTKPKAFAKAASISGKPSNSWLLTPKIQIREQKNLSMTLKETVNTPQFENFKIWISKDYQSGDPALATWEPLVRPSPPTNVPDGQWLDVPASTYDMSAYANQDVTIGFEFINDGSSTRRTWEVESLQFNGKGDKIEVGSGGQP